MELNHREKHSLRIVGAYVVFERKDHSSQQSSPSERDQQPRDLHEQALQRLEDGDSIRVERWHGHDLVLRGDLVVDAEALDEPTTDENEEQ
jgi:hypothetical protein